VIVIDANVLAHMFIHGEFSETAERALEKDPEWVSPLLWRSEFRNVLVKCMGKRYIEFDDAVHMMGAAEQLMEGNEYAVPSLDVLRIASSGRCTAYDAEYVVLARELGVKLVTLDAALLKGFPETAIGPDRFIAGT